MAFKVAPYTFEKCENYNCRHASGLQNDYCYLIKNKKFSGMTQSLPAKQKSCLTGSTTVSNVIQ